jgi:NADPH:quinone reductase-like Zn-dependent oxidoreductase
MDMRAIRMDGYGGPEVMHLAETAMPEPGAGEVRVKVRAAGVNPADVQWRSGLLAKAMPLSFPHTPGYDLAGTVDKLGEGVSHLVAGARVAGTTARTQGAYAEYAIIPVASLAEIPDTLDFANAAALPTPALTGVQLVEDVIRPQAGQLVLVTGAVGGVGRFSLYAALKLGARVVAAVRASQVAEALDLGAEATVVLGEDWTGEPFDGVANTLGGPDVARLCRHLKPGGVLGTVTMTPIDPEGLPSQPVFMALHGDGKRLAELALDVAAGKIAAPVAVRLPLADAAEAHRLLAAGGLGGKVVLEP